MYNKYLRPVWAEINLDNIAYNIKCIKEFIGKDILLMGVVKDDAYGLGTPGILDTLIEKGVDQLAVAVLDEAIEIREAGYDIPVLIFGYTPFEYSDAVVRFDISQTVYCLEQARALSNAANKLNKKANVHIKIDTGMGRLGFKHDENSLKVIQEIAELQGIHIEGVYTHCPVADERDKDSIEFTENQFKIFMDFLDLLIQRGINIPIRHMCSSAGIVHYPHMHLDMVRAGIVLYGSYPYYQNVLPLKSAMSLKTRIGFIKAVEAGRSISYGRNFITKRRSTIATLPIGYGDGCFSKMLSNKAEVLVKGRRVPVVGNICMDQCMIDLTDLNEKCEIGEEVVIFGKQGDEEIPVEELAEKICGSVSYEYMALTHKRVPRVYKKEGRVVKVINNLVKSKL